MLSHVICVCVEMMKQKCEMNIKLMSHTNFELNNVAQSFAPIHMVHESWMNFFFHCCHCGMDMLEWCMEPTTNWELSHATGLPMLHTNGTQCPFLAKSPNPNTFDCTTCDLSCVECNEQRKQLLLILSCENNDSD